MWAGNQTSGSTRQHMGVATFQQGRQRCVSVCVCVCVCVYVWTEVYLNFIGIIRVCTSGRVLLALLTTCTSVSVGAAIPSVLTQIV